MLNKIYLAVLALSIVVVGALFFYAFSWLGSVGAPNVAQESHLYFSSLGFTATLIATVVLLLLSFIATWSNRSAWTFLPTLLFFVLAMGVRYFWLFPAYADYLQVKNLPDTEFANGTGSGLLIIAFGGAAIFVTFFVTKLLLNKLKPVAEIEPQI